MWHECGNRGRLALLLPRFRTVGSSTHLLGQRETSKKSKKSRILQLKGKFLIHVDEEIGFLLVHIGFISRGTPALGAPQ